MFTRHYNNPIHWRRRGLLSRRSAASKEVLVLSLGIDSWMQSSGVTGKSMVKAVRAGSMRVEAVTTDNFVDIWNSATANYVIVHTHGKPDRLGGDGLQFKTSRMDELQNNTNIKLLLITACQVGGSNGDQANFGQLISQKIAPDGIVICSTTEVSGRDKNFTATDGGAWVVYQNGAQIDTLLPATITVADAVTYWRKHCG